MFRFTSKPGCDNYANCDGDYKLEEEFKPINGKQVFVNWEKEKFLAALPSSGWCITSVNYYEEVFNKQGLFGGFHSGGLCEPDEGIWKSYTVTRIGLPRSSSAESCFDDDESWRKFSNKTVSFKAVANSGAVRNRCDLAAMRRRCVALDCGGFSLTKAIFNQFGEETQPPICFFYRKSQKELHKALQDSDKSDFYIVSEKFHPNCSFKPGRDPAPSCHIRWEVAEKVHAFACQVQVSEVSDYTYWCVCGFHCGYSGIQQHEGKKQQILFSVWDHDTAPAKVKTPHVCDGMYCEPFGGEGKGMKATSISEDGDEHRSLAAWTAGTPYTFVVKAFPVAEGTELVCYIHKPVSGWRELARHVRPEPQSEDRGKLSQLYSFIEDFSGNSVRRSGSFAACVKVRAGDQWQPVTRVSGTSTAEQDVPNKCVRLVPDGCGGQRVDVTTGGDCLQDCSLYKGHMQPPPVPDILNTL